MKSAKLQNGSAGAIEWRRPERHVDKTTGFTWRWYLSRCLNVRVKVRLDGPDPLRRFYAERFFAVPYPRWSLIGTYRSKNAAQRACAKDLRRLPPQTGFLPWAAKRHARKEGARC